MRRLPYTSEWQAEVELLPVWWEKIFFIQPKRFVAVGAVVWRRMPEGYRLPIHLEYVLEDKRQSEHYMQALRRAREGKQKPGQE